MQAYIISLQTKECNKINVYIYGIKVKKKGKLWQSPNFQSVFPKNSSDSLETAVQW